MIDRAHVSYHRRLPELYTGRRTFLLVVAVVVVADVADDGDGIEAMPAARSE